MAERHNLMPRPRRQLSAGSLISDAATFHSAMAQFHSEKDPVPPTVDPEHQAREMARADSGYAELNPPDRRSSSSHRRRRQARPSSSKRSGSTNHPIPPVTSRPKLHSRHSTSAIHRPPTRDHQFVPFPTSITSAAYAAITPTITTTTHPPSDKEQPANHLHPRPLPPPTVHYWNSDETRRLEYAAIDAASRGVRGFLTRLVPDCMLPADFRRLRFHTGNEDDIDSDAGSVRRYRVHIPSEKMVTNMGGSSEEGPGVCVDAGVQAARKRPGFLKRLTSLGKESKNEDAVR